MEDAAFASALEAKIGSLSLSPLLYPVREMVTSAGAYSAALLPDQTTSPWKLASVFVSSTFVDFIRERALFKSVIEPRLRALCRAAGLELSVVEMSFGIPASPPPLAPGDPRAALTSAAANALTCLESLMRTFAEGGGAPVFLYLGGQRFGTGLSDIDADGLPVAIRTAAWVPGSSITALEAVMGALGPVNPRAVLYLRDAAYWQGEPTRASAGAAVWGSLTEVESSRQAALLRVMRETFGSRGAGATADRAFTYCPGRLRAPAPLAAAGDAPSAATPSLGASSEEEADWRRWCEHVIEATWRQICDAAGISSEGREVTLGIESSDAVDGTEGRAGDVAAAASTPALDSARFVAATLAVASPRERLTASLVARVHSATAATATGGSGQTLILHAASGAGKSTAAAWLMAGLHQQSAGAAVAGLHQPQPPQMLLLPPYFVGAGAGSRDPAALCRHVIAALRCGREACTPGAAYAGSSPALPASALSTVVASLSHLDSDALTALALRDLSGCSSSNAGGCGDTGSTCMVLLLDALDSLEAPTTDATSSLPLGFLPLLAGVPLARDIVLVLTVAEPSMAAAALITAAARHPTCVLSIPLLPLDHTERLEVITTLLHAQHKDPAALRAPAFKGGADGLQLLLNAPGAGSPLWLCTAVLRLKRAAAWDTAAEVCAAMPGDLDALLDDELAGAEAAVDTLQRGGGNAPPLHGAVQAAVLLLAAARDGLTLAEIRTALPLLCAVLEGHAANGNELSVLALARLTAEATTALENTHGVPAATAVAASRLVEPTTSFDVEGIRGRLEFMLRAQLPGDHVIRLGHSRAVAAAFRRFLPPATGSGEPSLLRCARRVLAAAQFGAAATMMAAALACVKEAAPPALEALAGPPRAWVPSQPSANDVPALCLGPYAGAAAAARAVWYRDRSSLSGLYQLAELARGGGHPALATTSSIVVCNTAPVLEAAPAAAAATSDLVLFGGALCDAGVIARMWRGGDVQHRLEYLRHWRIAAFSNAERRKTARPSHVYAGVGVMLLRACRRVIVTLSTGLSPAGSASTACCELVAAASEVMCAVQIPHAAVSACRLWLQVPLHAAATAGGDPVAVLAHCRLLLSAAAATAACGDIQMACRHAADAQSLARSMASGVRNQQQQQLLFAAAQLRAALAAADGDNDAAAEILAEAIAQHGDRRSLSWAHTTLQLALLPTSATTAAEGARMSATLATAAAAFAGQFLGTKHPRFATFSAAEITTAATAAVYTVHTPGPTTAVGAAGSMLTAVRVATARLLSTLQLHGPQSVEAAAAERALLSAAAVVAVAAECAAQGDISSSSSNNARALEAMFGIWRAFETDVSLTRRILCRMLLGWCRIGARRTAAAALIALSKAIDPRIAGDLEADLVTSAVREKLPAEALRAVLCMRSDGYRVSRDISVVLKPLDELLIGDKPLLCAIASRGTTGRASDRSDERSGADSDGLSLELVVAVRAVLGDGSDVNFKLQTWAESSEQLSEVVRLLVSAGAGVSHEDEVSCSPLRWAIISGNCAAAAALLAAGARADAPLCADLGMWPLPEAVVLMRRDPEADEQGCDDTSIGTASSSSVRERSDLDTSRADLALMTSACRHSSSSSTAVEAAPESSAARRCITIQLLEAGAFLGSTPRGAACPLHAAAAAGCAEGAKVLCHWLRSPRDGVPSLVTMLSNIDASGRTPLHVACELRAHSVALATASVLLHFGADPAAVDGHGRSPLHAAAAANNPGLVKRLLASVGSESPTRNKALFAARDEAGETALDVAARNGNENAVGALYAWADTEAFALDVSAYPRSACRQRRDSCMEEVDLDSMFAEVAPPRGEQRVITLSPPSRVRENEREDARPRRRTPPRQQRAAPPPLFAAIATGNVRAMRTLLGLPPPDLAMAHILSHDDVARAVEPEEEEEEGGGAIDDEEEDEEDGGFPAEWEPECGLPAPVTSLHPPHPLTLVGNAKGALPLFAALDADATPALRLLLDEATADAAARDAFGRPCLHIALERGVRVAAAALLAAGAPPDASSCGDTALHCAAGSGDAAAVIALLARGCVAAPVAELLRRTPAHAAAEALSQDAMDTLARVCGGAVLTQPDETGASAIDLWRATCSAAKLHPIRATAAREAAARWAADAARQRLILAALSSASGVGDC